MPLRTGSAEERNEAGRLEPLALAAADNQTEVRQNQQDEAVEECHALVAVVHPEHRGTDALGEQQAGGAANEGAEHVGDGGIAQLPFEQHANRGQHAAERDVQHGLTAEWLQHERRVRYCPDKEQAREYEPGHI